MSHFVETKLTLSNPRLIEEALVKMGYKVQRGPQTVRNAYGGQVDADISVVGYPIGFVKQDGSYSLVADWWGLKVDRQTFVRDLKKNYTKLQVSEACKKVGLTEGQWVEQEDGSLRMVAVRRSW